MIVPKILAPLGQTPSFHFSLESCLADDFFALSLWLMVNQLHEAVIESWRKFHESNQKIAEDNTQTFRARQIRHVQEDAILQEGERRHIEFRA